MHITLEADYAVRIVQVLAQSNKRLDAKTISEMTGVTLRFSLKILRKLVAAGIIMRSDDRLMKSRWARSLKPLKGDIP